MDEGGREGRHGLRLLAIAISWSVIKDLTNAMVPGGSVVFPQQ
ncbi:MAG: hypothetical protein ACI861_002264, partial [Paracoccaceae bacterium]